MAREKIASSDPLTLSPCRSGGGAVISPNAPRPRLCKLQRWVDFAGYGFDLCEERQRTGHFVGSVDAGSPADAGGLRKGDELIEVNGHNVLSATHQDVVALIERHEDSVQLLVVDTDAKEYYEDNTIWVHSKMANVDVIECPRRSSEGKQAAEAWSGDGW